MSRVLLDTSGYSALLRGHPEVKLAVQKAEAIHVNPVVLGELLAGFQKGGRQKKNEEELASFLSSPRVETLSMDGDTARRYAVILNSLWKAGKPVPTNDLWIAASAMQHGLSVLTTDAHFNEIPQVLVEHFDPRAA